MHKTHIESFLAYFFASFGVFAALGGSFILGIAFVTSGQRAPYAAGSTCLASAITLFFIAVLAILAVGIGTLLRHTAGSVVLLFVVLFVLGIAVGFLPSTWGDTVNKFLPSNAGGAILDPVHKPGSLAPWTGLGVFALYTAVVLAAALVMFERRDA